MRRFAFALVVSGSIIASASALVGGCSSSDSGSAPAGGAFCDDYGKKLVAIGCKGATDPTPWATLCTEFSKAETKCLTQYQATLTCQTKTSKCDGDKLSFGACPAEQTAYSDCKNGTTTDAGGDSGGGDTGGGDAGGTLCEKAAAKAVPLKCSGDPSDVTAFAKKCEEARTLALSKACGAEIDAYLACAASATDTACDADNEAIAPSCKSKLDAALACVSGGDAGTEDAP
jgi:hypothetical protein